MNTFRQNGASDAIVLGGGWESHVERPRLTMELRMRLLAAGVLALRGDINSAIFSGGLVDQTSNVDEAEGMNEFFTNRFPQLKFFPITLDNRCFDTVSSALSVRSIVQTQEHPNDPRYLLTSRSHLRRSTTIFQTAGLPVVPLEAEAILREISLHHDTFVSEYLHSVRHAKRMVIESIGRTILRFDSDGSYSQLLAGKIRRQA